MPPFQYPRARVDRIVDGDTLEVSIDLGFYITRSDQKVRLIGVDTHETWFVSHDSEEYIRGMEEKEFVEDWLVTAEQGWKNEWPLEIHTQKDRKGKYGRYLGYIVRKSDGEQLNERLLEEFDGIGYEV